MQELNNSRKTLDIKTFGTFSIKVDGHSITDISSRSGKIWTLFKYIISHRSSPIPTDRLINILWPEDEVEKPINALFTLVYRLRNLLNEPFDERQNFIIFHHDCYIWNKDAPYTLDAEQFEDSIAALDADNLTSDERLNLGRKAFDLYRGDYLPELSDDWLISINYYYKRLYATLVPKLASLMAESNDLDSVIKLCERAIELDPYEEAHHITLIDTLIHLGQTSQALAHHDFITYILQKERGVRPSKSLLGLRNRMYQQTEKARSVEEIKASLSEQENLLPGAFFCDFDAFRHIFRLEERMARRADHLAFLVEMTVNMKTDNATGYDEALNKAMTILRRTALFTLRRNDVITQYSHAQLLLLLQSNSIDVCEDVLCRIHDRFFDDTKGEFPCSVEYSISQI